MKTLVAVFAILMLCAACGGNDNKPSKPSETKTQKTDTSCWQNSNVAVGDKLIVQADHLQPRLFVPMRNERTQQNVALSAATGPYGIFHAKSGTDTNLDGETFTTVTSPEISAGMKIEVLNLECEVGVRKMHLRIID